MTHPYTPAQLEAWAGLGPVNSKEYDGDSWWLYWSIVDQNGYTICDFHQEGEDFVDALAAAPDLARLVLERDAEIAALQAFKNYVHERLDKAGIPTHPDGEHSKAGCRIGDRLDIALAAHQAMKETSDETAPTKS